MKICLFSSLRPIGSKVLRLGVLPTLFALAIMCSEVHGQGSYTAASCNYSDVNAVINGSKHVAVDGDTINIPAGSCTWTSGLTVPLGIGISIIGSGASTVITDNVASGPLIQAHPTFGNSLMRVSSIGLAQGASATYSPFLMIGSCTASGCPNLRIDNITFSGWTAGNQAGWLIRTSNVFGVVDHNTVSSSAVQALVNMNHGGYLGTGHFGDNSWAAANSFGTANALYLETNTMNNSGEMVDCDIADSDQNIGGCRFVVRFNTINGAGQWVAAPHGTETTGRPRGGRQYEAYNNNVICTNSTGGCSIPFGFRSATGLIFDNTFTRTAGWFNALIQPSAYRTYGGFWPWGTCGGVSPWDTNDGGTVTSGSTFTSIGTTSVTDTAQSWTANQFAPGAGGKYWTLYNATAGDQDDIVSNTSNTLTLRHDFTASPAHTWHVGDTYYINGTTLYAMGTISSSTSTSITDTAKSWTANQWYAGSGDSGNPYSFIDVSATNNYYFGDFAWEITGNTSNTLNSSFLSNNGTRGTVNLNAGDTYVVVRSSVCLDQPARGGGNLLTSSTAGTPITPVGPVNQILEPIYEWGDTISGGNWNYGVVMGGTNGGAGTLKLIANRDWYVEAQNQSAQTSSTSPFNGTTGVGHGALANRPAICTTGVAYWATDQGNWNQSGGDQGQLYKCTSTNTWTLAYTPFTYPHPLVSGNLTSSSPPTAGAPNPPTNLAATVQ